MLYIPVFADAILDGPFPFAMKNLVRFASLALIPALALFACSAPTGTSGSVQSSRSSSSAAPNQFIVPPTIQTVEGEDVIVHVYARVRDARLDAAKVSPDGRMIGNRGLVWKSKPHFFRKDAAIAVYDGTNPKVLNALKKQFGKQFAGQ